MRKILSRNIKTIRGTLHISQAKLAKYAGISLSYLTDIERCRTWVSDKTLQNLAKALNREAWELLLPNLIEENGLSKQDSLQDIADLIAIKKETLRHAVDETMEELVLEIIQKREPV